MVLNGCQTTLLQPGPLTADTFAQLLRGEARPNSQRNRPRSMCPPPALSTDALDSRGPALRPPPCAGPRNLLQCPALPPWSSPGHWRETVWRILAYYFPAVLYWRRGRTFWYPPQFFCQSPRSLPVKTNNSFRSFSQPLWVLLFLHFPNGSTTSTSVVNSSNQHMPSGPFGWCKITLAQ